MNKIQLKTHFQRCLAWYLAGLALLVPDKLRHTGQPGRILLLYLIDDRLHICRDSNSESETIEWSFDLHDPAKVEHCQQYLAHHHINGGESILLLESSNYLQRQLQLPIAARENLYEILGFEMDRQTPFSADEVYFDYQLAEKSNHDEYIIVDLVLAQRGCIDNHLKRLADLGISPDRIDIATPEGSGAGFNLTTRTSKSDTRDAAARNKWALWILAGILLLTVIYLPLLKQHQHLTTLQKAVEARQGIIKRLEKLQQKHDALLRRSQFLTTQARKYPTAIEIVDELTQRLPDDTWLERLTYSDNTVHLIGESSNASALVSIVQSSPYFIDVRFRSPVTHNGKTNQEKYHLSAQITGDTDAPDSR